MPEPEIQGLITIAPGDTYRAREVRAAVRHLFETGKFKEVWTTAEASGEDKVILQFRWLGNRVLTSTQISGNHLLSDQEVLETMGLSLGAPFSEAAWNRGLETLAARYRENGYFQLKTASQLKPPPGDRQGLAAALQIREGYRARIRQISFIGEGALPSGSLGLRIYSQKGEYYIAQNLKEDLVWLQNYYAKQGYYKAIVGPAVIEHDADTNTVAIAVSIQAQYKIDIRFEGQKILSRSELKKRMLIEKERSDSLEVLDDSVRQIEQYYRGEGFPDAQVTYTSETFENENRKVFHFLIESGVGTQIEKIIFSGHYAFSEKTLRNQIALQESKVFRKRPYVKADHEADAEALFHFYREAGFQKVRVKTEVEFRKSGHAAWVYFKIDEGVRTRFDPIEIQGNEALAEDRLKESLNIEDQEPFTPGKVQQGARELYISYASVGYLYAEIEPEVDHPLGETNAKVTYRIKEGNQVRLGRVILEGNLRTRPDILLRRLSLHPGDPYDPGKIVESQKKIYQTGLFSSVRFERIDPQDRNTLQDLTLKVVERPSIGLEFGIGYGDRERLRGIIEIAHRNLWGRHQEISARAEGSRVEERYFLNYKKPWFYHESLTARISVAYLNVEEVSFDLKSFSGLIGVDKDFSETVKGSLLYQFERKEPADVDDPTKFDPADIGPIEIGSLNPSLIRDTRDDAFNPSSGSVNGILLRDAAKILGSEVQLVKVILQSRWYYRLTEGSVFAFSARGGAAERFGKTETIHISERFFLGGRNTVRGYDQDKLGIEGATINDGVPIGGNAMIVFNEELRLRLPKSFGLVFFFDHGNVWADRSDIDLSELKTTTGIGLRYNTPIGPFRLDWGYKLNRVKDEDPWAVHFSLGHTF